MKIISPERIIFDIEFEFDEYVDEFEFDEYVDEVEFEDQFRSYSDVLIFYNNPYFNSTVKAKNDLDVIVLSISHDIISFFRTIVILKCSPISIKKLFELLSSLIDLCDEDPLTDSDSALLNNQYGNALRCLDILDVIYPKYLLVVCVQPQSNISSITSTIAAQLFLINISLDPPQKQLMIRFTAISISTKCEGLPFNPLLAIAQQIHPVFSEIQLYPLHSITDPHLPSID
ncbi:MAG: hypothetical protein EZS28_022424 [Streblomastix strix]|uniref:Uncharacterized protein n=1 Tax=Streblomastix strix TaxID=222440 RepID=A0A5J4VHF3_9EUKA|nr:MAG: hypothetical protein EZS28_022424 [Streblomastix strix]